MGKEKNDLLTQAVFLTLLTLHIALLLGISVLTALSLAIYHAAYYTTQALYYTFYGLIEGTKKIYHRLTIVGKK